jgi:hypothetical protein
MHTSPGGTQYYMSTISPTWSDAAALCAGLDMHLVKVNSKAVSDDLNALALQLDFGYYWIGATDEAVEGTFVWMDGSEVTYFNWGGAEPNNIYGENCIDVRPGWGWNDQGCGSPRLFVCAAKTTVGECQAAAQYLTYSAMQAALPHKLANGKLAAD